MKLPAYIREHEPLAPYTSFHIGGPARFFTEAKSERELVRAVRFARRHTIPFRVIGGGTNVLVADAGFSGLIIRTAYHEIVPRGQYIHVAAGTPMGTLIAYSEQAKLAGLAWAAGLPGTLGGAIYGNAGCFGGETKDVIRTVRVLDSHGRVRLIPARQAGFGYRTSRFKSGGGIILSAELALVPARAVGHSAREVLRSRMSGQPSGIRTEGCMFKNIEALAQPLQIARAYRLYPELRAHMKDTRLPAGYLIEHAGLKGYRMGNVGVSDLHANFLVNHGGGSAEEMRILASIIKQRVRNRYGLFLDEEVQMVGF